MSPSATIFQRRYPLELTIRTDVLSPYRLYWYGQLFILSTMDSDCTGHFSPAPFLTFAAAAPEPDACRTQRLAWHEGGRQFTPAAVLVGFVPDSDGIGILLTVRSARLRTHSKQVAFPGGQIDACDAGETAAALRETQEELGITPDWWETHGSLPPRYLPSGYRVTPILTSTRRQPTYRPSTQEVAEVFVLPQTLALDTASYRFETYRQHGLTIDMPILRYGRHTVWGATASILYRLAVLYGCYIGKAT